MCPRLGKRSVSIADVALTRTCERITMRGDEAERRRLLTCSGTQTLRRRLDSRPLILTGFALENGDLGLFGLHCLA